MEDQVENAAEQNTGVFWLALAAMEAYRLKKSGPDFDIRICEAILAEALGLKSRTMWTCKIEWDGIFDYDGDAEEQYRTLLERIKNEVK